MRLLAIIALIVLANSADAGPFRNRGGSSCSNGSCGAAQIQTSQEGTYQQVCNGTSCSMQFVPQTVAKRVMVTGYIENGIFYQTSVVNDQTIQDKAKETIQDKAKETGGNLDTPNCKCGCTKGDPCTCKDCDHPKMAWTKVN